MKRCLCIHINYIHLEVLLFFTINWVGNLVLWNSWNTLSYYTTAYDSTSFTKFVFFGPIHKLSWQPGDSGLVSSFWPNMPGSNYSLNPTKLTIFFWAKSITKMTAVASDCLRPYRLLFCNHRIYFNDTWLEASIQHPLSSCFQDQSVNKRGSS